MFTCYYSKTSRSSKIQNSFFSFWAMSKSWTLLFCCSVKLHIVHSSRGSDTSAGCHFQRLQIELACTHTHSTSQCDVGKTVFIASGLRRPCHPAKTVEVHPRLPKHRGVMPVLREPETRSGGLGEKPRTGLTLLRTLLESHCLSVQCFWHMAITFCTQYPSEIKMFI